MYLKMLFVRGAAAATFLFCVLVGSAQVELRDTVVTWRHHQFELHQDYSMMSFTTSDDEITEVVFSDAKVIENELIRLVVLPGYGARVLSFVYKPTGHEYLYQSACGSAYGMGEGNFYYDWLMVYGGIFPTLPESEHGKTWLLPWTYTVVKATEEEVTIRMEHTDNQSYNGAPGKFNNGITGITCRVEVSVYQNQSKWDFDVSLINEKETAVNYEYWTCTTLAPGSEPGDTGTPQSAEIVAAANEYLAGWSPGAWIGGNNQRYDFADINVLDEWENMGIAYAERLNGNYWGVINHENEEGIFRISENTETPGMKLWTWGRNNIDNNLYDFSNGGADNYIELWAGTSKAFFEDATLAAGEVKQWRETYCPTIGVTAIDTINQLAVLHAEWQEATEAVRFEANTFNAATAFRLLVELRDGQGETQILRDELLDFDPMGLAGEVAIGPLDLPAGQYEMEVKLTDEDGNAMISTQEAFRIEGPLASLQKERMSVRSTQNGYLSLGFSESGHTLQVVNIQGQVLYYSEVTGKVLDVPVPASGLYILTLSGAGFAERTKVIATR